MTLSKLPKTEAALLELAAVTGVQEHYRSNGFTVVVLNPGGKKAFKVKTSTKGHPWNFSRVRVSKGLLVAELHMNLVVTGAHDEGRYCVDVAITQPNKVPSSQPKEAWTSLANSDLISIAEVKRLVVYPMLLAQFIGIVHEIKPEFLAAKKVRNVDRWKHLPPTLIALGNFSGNSKKIVDYYVTRKLQVHVAENFDMRMAAQRKGTSASPLYWNK